MSQTLKFAVVGCAALTLAACAGTLVDDARVMTPQGSAFDNALYTGYLARAQDEFDEGDYRDSDYFANRAMFAARGTAVAPTSVGDRDIPDAAVMELRDARARLVAALDASARVSNPEQAAKAQVCFDSWMQEQEENTQPEHIARDRDCFGEAMAALGTPAMGPAVQVFFDTGSAKPTSENVLNIQTGAEMISAAPGSSVLVVGHADSVGNPVANQALSERRAETVRAILLEMGVTAPISTEGRGESEAMELLGDDEPSLEQRRADIFIEK